jgi:hypothetical protein
LPQEVAELIIYNRSQNFEYDRAGDVVRYAGDLLDYMALADLISLKQNYKYYLNNHHIEVLKSFAESNNFFTPYESLYSQENIEPHEISSLTDSWFDYINNTLDDSIFKTDILAMLQEGLSETTEPETPANQFIQEILDKLRKESTKPKNTKEIGDVGESIVIEHEKNRLVKIDITFEKMLHYIKKLPEHFAVGYDIQSLEGVSDQRRYIEVKTTLSMGKLSASRFHMTPSEWSAASSINKAYFIYRLMISRENISLFVIQDPVGKYKNSLIEMIPRDGAEIRYSNSSGNFEELCV